MLHKTLERFVQKYELVPAGGYASPCLLIRKGNPELCVPYPHAAIWNSCGRFMDCNRFPWSVLLSAKYNERPACFNAVKMLCLFPHLRGPVAEVHPHYTGQRQVAVFGNTFRIVCALVLSTI